MTRALLTDSQRPEPNRGTERGRALVRESIDACGFGRSVVVDKNGRVVVGAKVAEAAKERGADVEVVPTDGHALVVVQRVDLDLDHDVRARQLAYYDNRSSEVDLSWAPDVIQSDVADGLDLSGVFFPEELDAHLPEPVLDDAPTSVPIEAPVPVSAMPSLAERVELPSSMEASAEPASPSSVVKVEVSFANLQARVQWAGLLRVLKTRYPEATTAAQLLLRYVAERHLGDAARG